MAQFEDTGYRRNPYDKCIITLPRQDTPGVPRADKSKAHGAAGSSSSGGRAKPGPSKLSEGCEHLNEGIILIEVDDILEGGSPIHRERMEQFYSKWKCGKRKTLRECGTEGSMISGVNVVQHQD